VTDLLITDRPHISYPRFCRVLTGDPATFASRPSPMAGDMDALWDTCLTYRVDPAIWLAFAFHESELGTTGLCASQKLFNPCNVRTPYSGRWRGKPESFGSKGQFCRYPTWVSACADWCERLQGAWYAGEGLLTVPAVVHKYAPSWDKNNEAAYVAAVNKCVGNWA
jgi:hypothetical protein